jgi:hypothetical protein
MSSDNKNNNQHCTPVYATAVHVENQNNVVQSIPVVMASPQGILSLFHLSYNICISQFNCIYELGETRAICRGCGREYIRPAGCHDGQAQYYRCSDCNQLSWDMFCIVM